MFPIIFNGVPWQPFGKMAVSTLRMTALMGVLLVAVVALLGRVEIAHAVPVRDDEYLIYGTATAEGMESLQRLVDVVPHWESVTTHGEGVEGNFELRLSEPPVLSAVASVGGYINRAILDDGELTLSLRLSPSADVRRVIDAVQTAHPTAELLKRRQRTLINESTDGLESTLTEIQGECLTLEWSL
ncbi:MAG: bacterio-opsin activator domain-containing protein [Haloarculaceae archaeon]